MATCDDTTNCLLWYYLYYAFKVMLNQNFSFALLYLYYNLPYIYLNVMERLRVGGSVSDILPTDGLTKNPLFCVSLGPNVN